MFGEHLYHFHEVPRIIILFLLTSTFHRRHVHSTRFPINFNTLAYVLSARYYGLHFLGYGADMIF